MMQGDTTRLPLRAGQKRTEPQEYACLSPLMIFAGSWMAAILPDKTQHSATKYFSSRGVMNARYD